MLDDLQRIHELDAQDALGIASNQWQQLTHNFNFSWQPEREIHNVVIAGMGGSGLAAKAFGSWPGLKVPLSIIQDYDLPYIVTENTLIICLSYSGNTEETLSVFAEAVQKNALVVVIASGGKLLEQAKAHGLPFAELPAGLQPRMTFGYQLRALVEVLEQTPLLDGALEQLPTAAEWLKNQISQWLPTVLTEQNQAKQIAEKLADKSIVVYSGPKLHPAAYKWKINCNENAKHIAWANQYPEFNHNEMLGWTEQLAEKPYAVVELRSKLEHPRIQKRFEVTEKLLKGQRPEPIVIEAQGQTILEQLLYLVALGDFTSLYLALLNNLNPTPVELIEKFKQALDE
jgi:glucose/mannose-6-phosphate isomerase